MEGLEDPEMEVGVEVLALLLGLGKDPLQDEDGHEEGSFDELVVEEVHVRVPDMASFAADLVGDLEHGEEVG